MDLNDTRTQLRTSASTSILARGSAMDQSPYSGSASTTSAHEKRRWTSKFKEIGLDDGYEDIAPGPSRDAPFHRRSNTHHAGVLHEHGESDTADSEIGTPRIENPDPAFPRTSLPSMTRLHLLALILVITIPLLYNIPFTGRSGHGIVGVEGRVIERSAVQERAANDGELVSRDNSPTDVCTRWSHQSNVTFSISSETH